MFTGKYRIFVIFLVAEKWVFLATDGDTQQNYK